MHYNFSCTVKVIYLMIVSSVIISKICIYYTAFAYGKGKYSIFLIIIVVCAVQSKIASVLN